MILQERISERRKIEAKNESLLKLSEYKMLLRIVAAPHIAGGRGVASLQQNLEEMQDEIINPENAEFREKTREKLKELLSEQIKELGG